MKKLINILAACTLSLTAFAGADTWSVPQGEWTPLGMGRLTDDMLTAWYQYEPLTWEVAIEQSVENPNYYRVIAPYGENFKNAFQTANNVKLDDQRYDKEGTAVWIFDVTDPDAVYFPKTYINCDWGSGPIYIGIPTTADPVWKNGVMTSTPRGMAIGDDSGAVAMNMRGKFQLSLPGAYEPDYTLSLTTDDECLNNRQTTGKLTVGLDIATVKCAVFNDAFEDEIIDMYRMTENSGSTINFRGAVDITMDPETTKTTIVFVGLDSDGNRVAQTWKTFYYVDAADSEDWQNEGMAHLTTNFFAFYNDIEVENDCMLQRHKYRPGYLRLVNPLKGTKLDQERYMHSGHDHFIYINADDPELIYFEQAPLGVDFGHGQCRLWSDVGYYLAAGFEYEDCKDMGLGLEVDGNTWTAPDEHCQFSAMNYDNADWYMCDGGTTIEMPESFVLGVGNIATDTEVNAPIEYYNLQGVRVTKPSAGQVVIRRQGSQVSKMIVR